MGWEQDGPSVPSLMEGPQCYVVMGGSLGSDLYPGAMHWCLAAF